jgi:hypothetical protein
MLPDLRIVIAAVVSTFIFTVGVGFFASSRLIHEQMTARVDTKGFDDTPVNRIALNWPEPVKTERNVDLDFAVSAKGSRNPVREVASDAEPQQQAQRQHAQQPQPQPVEQLAQASKPEAQASAPATPATAPEIAVPGPDAVEPAAQEPAPREAEPAIIIAKAPDPAKAAPPAAPAAPIPSTAPPPPEPPQSATDTHTTDTHVIVRPGDSLPVESTGSIAAAAPETPDIPLPASRPKFAARPDGADRETAKPAVSAAAPAAVKRRARPAPRPQVNRNQPTQSQQLPPFDFFGLFRTPPATLRLPPQVAVPTTPIN